MGHAPRPPLVQLKILPANSLATYNIIQLQYPKVVQGNWEFGTSLPWLTLRGLREKPITTVPSSHPLCLLFPGVRWWGDRSCLSGTWLRGGGGSPAAKAHQRGCEETEEGEQGPQLQIQEGVPIQIAPSSTVQLALHCVTSLNLSYLLCCMWNLWQFWDWMLLYCIACQHSSALSDHGAQEAEEMQSFWAL